MQIYSFCFSHRFSFSFHHFLTSSIYYFTASISPSSSSLLRIPSRLIRLCRFLGQKAKLVPTEQRNCCTYTDAKKYRLLFCLLLYLLPFKMSLTEFYAQRIDTYPHNLWKTFLNWGIISLVNKMLFARYSRTFLKDKNNFMSTYLIEMLHKTANCIWKMENRD